MGERFNQETDPSYNARKSGIAIIRESPYANEMAKFEQFENNPYGTPGNPYVYRPFPKMLYRAQLRNGKPMCMAAPPEPMDFAGNPGGLQMAEEGARAFNERCTIVVKDEREMQAAMENGYRHSPEEAVEYLRNRQQAEFVGVGHRNYEDRGMSEAAKAEAKAEAARVFDEEGRQAPEIKEKPRRRGRPRKTQPAA